MSENEPIVVNSEKFHSLVKEGEDTSDVILRKQFTPDNIEKSGDEGEERTVKFVISTDEPDRDNDIISTKGWDLDAYKKNPVVLFAHDSRSRPIAQATEVSVENGALKATAKFATHEMNAFADSIYQMIQGDFLRATSVGFMPQKFSINEDRGGLDFEEQQLMEFSVVPVPANPQALVEAKSKGYEVEPYSEWLEQALDEWLNYKDLFLMPRKDIEKMYFAANGEDLSKATSRRTLKVVNSEGEDVVDNSTQNSDESAKETEEETAKEAEEEVSAEETPTEETTDKSSEEETQETDKSEKTTISYSRAHSSGTPKASKDREWDGPSEVANADVEGLWVMSAWVADLDEGEEEHDKGDFKLPHHVAEGKHAVVWRGVVAAMASLMGARGGVDVPEDDRKGIYNHLAKHYREFDEEPPSFEAAEDQILTKDGWTMDYETGHPVTVIGGEVKYFQPSESDDMSKELLEELKALRNEVAELREAVNTTADGDSEEETKETDEPETEDKGQSDNSAQKETEEPTSEEIEAALKEVLSETDLDSIVEEEVKSLRDSTN